MQTQSLNGYWQIRAVNTQDWLPASVPGGVYTDLMAANRLPDPFYCTNEEQVQWVAEKSWEYRRFFYPLAAMLRQERIWLTCDGLDTLAEVRLNGKILGQADNMFRSWQWEVKNLLVEGENKLEILFRSPVGYARTRQRVKPMRDMNIGIPGGQYLRKTPSHFGWDWGPRLPGIGIWQSVHLEGRTQGQLGEIRFDQEHTPGLVTLTARVQCELWEQSDPRRTVRLRITGPDRQVWLLDAPARPQSSMTVTLPNPQLWWPNGYGPQNLYTVEVELLGEEEHILDQRSFNIGLRTIELRHQDAQTGKSSFTFVVNGLPIFCKGSNWIPADSFPARISPERVENLIRAAVESHQNMLRVWGGGYYESETFYNLCDRYGVLVWQDFQFACATYPLDDPAFLDNVRCEIIENIKRLRHHACLTLWCGNNEIEWLGTKMGWFNTATQKAHTESYQRFFFQDLPAILSVEDPQRPYWPGSPSSNDPFNNPNNHNIGDAHLWEVFAEYRLPNFYRSQTPRFVSEFGFQSLPDVKTIAQFAPPDSLSLDSPAMCMHQRAPSGNHRLLWYLAQRFRLPCTFEGLVYLSQVYQAEAIRTGIEHWRRHPDQTSGALYWQLNDCWPVISWSSIDYYGRWKALHYAARRFYAPVLLSVEDVVESGQRKMNVWVSNDNCEAWQGQVHWTLETLDGEVIEGGNQPVLSTPQSALCLLNLDFSHHNGKVNWRKVVFVAELRQGQVRHALQIAAFMPEKNMALPRPELQFEVNENDDRLQIQVKAKRLARFVEISFAEADATEAVAKEAGATEADAQFSNNYFDLPSGRTETIECEMPKGWTIEQARAALRIRSLADIGPCDSLIKSQWKGNLAFIRGLWDLFWKCIVWPVFSR